MCRSAQLRFDWTDVNFPLFVGTLHIALYNKSKNALFLQYNLDLAKNLPFIHKRNYIQSSLKILEALQRTFSKNIFSEKKIRFFYNEAYKLWMLFWNSTKHISNMFWSSVFWILWLFWAWHNMFTHFKCTMLYFDGFNRSVVAAFVNAQFNMKLGRTQIGKGVKNIFPRKLYSMQS